MKETVLFDIDGTLADIDHRRGLVESARPNWRAFFAAMGDDIPNEAVVTLYKKLWDAEAYELIIVSGRPDRYRKITEQWLSWNKIPFNRLMMRAHRDGRADYHVKEDILNSLIGEGKKIAFVIDDRQTVVDMWRRNGITCLQCDYGDF